VSPAFAASVQSGDLIVAGRNFGCGSAMEVAVTVIQAAGIHAVVARSFARSFFRNAINNGLLVVECDTSSFQEGDRVSIDVSERAVLRAQRHARSCAGRGPRCRRSSSRSSPARPCESDGLLTRVE
jgi:3-isopropylmalate/(R)-2-methylmalate dehydratase small subunit